MTELYDVTDTIIHKEISKEIFFGDTFWKYIKNALILCSLFRPLVSCSVFERSLRYALSYRIVTLMVWSSPILYGIRSETDRRKQRA